VRLGEALAEAQKNSFAALPMPFPACTPEWFLHATSFYALTSPLTSISHKRLCAHVRAMGPRAHSHSHGPFARALKSQSKFHADPLCEANRRGPTIGFWTWSRSDVRCPSQKAITAFMLPAVETAARWKDRCSRARSEKCESRDYSSSFVNFEIILWHVFTACRKYDNISLSYPIEK